MIDRNLKSYQRLGKRTRLGAIVLFSVFVANVIAGKTVLVLGWGLATPLDGPPEFILLFFSVLLFNVHVLCLEQEQETN